jgi:hypothetical protein
MRRWPTLARRLFGTADLGGFNAARLHRRARALLRIHRMAWIVQSKPCGASGTP